MSIVTTPSSAAILADPKVLVREIKQARSFTLPMFRGVA
jgi:hypothetical protein